MDLLSLDLYGLTPSILHKEKKKFNTYLGIIFTFITAGIFLLVLGISLHEMFSRTKPQVVQSTVVNINPSQFELNKDNFTFLGALEYSNARFYIDESVYSLEITENVHTQKDNGIYDVTRIPIKTKICAEIESKLINKKFSHLPLEHLYCPDPDETFSIQGIFGSNVYISLSVEIKRCNPNQRKCKSEEEIDSILSGGFFGFFISDSTFEPTNSTEPFTKYSANFFTTISPSEYKLFNIPANKNISNTDFGILTEDLTEIVDFSLDSFSESVMASQGGLIVDINLFFNNKTKEYNRSYLKIQRVAAEVGAITNFFIVVFGSLNRLIAEKHLYVKLCEDLRLFKNNASKIFDLSLDSSKIALDKTKTKNVVIPKNKTFLVLLGMFGCKSKTSNVYASIKTNFQTIKEKLNITSLLQLHAELSILKKVLLEPHQIRMLQYAKNNLDNLSLISEKDAGEYKLFEADAARMRSEPVDINERIAKLLKIVY